MYKLRVAAGQNLMDVCMTVYGSAEALVDLCADNGLSLDAAVVAGQELSIDPEKVRDADLVAYYQSLGNYQVTSGEQEAPGGIGYWVIGNEFKVS